MSYQENEPKTKSEVSIFTEQGTHNLKNYESTSSDIPFSKSIEKQIKRIPTIVFLSLATASMTLSLGIALRSERKDKANFVGLWAPSFLLLGLYNMIIKNQSPEQMDKV